MTTTRNVRRAWVRTAVAALAVAGVVGACTGDDGVKVIADDSDPVVALMAAAEAMPDSGRVRSTMEIDYSEFNDEDTATDEFPSGMSMVVEGEFSGDRSRFVSSVGDMGGGTGSFETEVRQIGTTVFYQALPMIESMAASFQGFADDELGSGSEYDTYLQELEQQMDAARAALADRPWVREESVDGAESFFSLGYGAGADLDEITDPASVISELSDVTRGDPVTRDDETFEVFEGRLDPERMWSVSGDDEVSEDQVSDDEFNDVLLGEAATPEERARVERIEEYGADRVGVDVTIDVDEQGLLRRMEMTTRDEVEDQYRDCYFLSSGGGSLTTVVEFSDLGAEFTIEEPDPATVIDAAEFDEIGLFGTSGDGDDVGSEGTATTVVSGVDPASDFADLARAELSTTLRDGADLIGIDPAAIDAMSDDEIEAAIEQLDVARESLPVFDTRMGEMDRIEMLRIIRVGVEMLGLESLDLSGQTDEQLAELINSYIDANGGPVGSGPNDAALRGEEYIPDDEGGSDLSEFEYDMFEGCPA